jgi:phosphatidylglycerophosphatase A
LIKKSVDNLAVALATWFGSGLSPKAPGTVGSLATLPFLWLISKSGPKSTLETAVVIIIIGVIACWAIWYTERMWQVHDDPRIVADEVTGLSAALIWFPFDIKHVVIGFTIFRLLDIWKPGPIGYIDEEIPGAAGTLFDDVVAGLVSAIILYLLFHQTY